MPCNFVVLLFLQKCCPICFCNVTHHLISQQWSKFQVYLSYCEFSPLLRHKSALPLAFFDLQLHLHSCAYGTQWSELVPSKPRAASQPIPVLQRDHQELTKARLERNGKCELLHSFSFFMCLSPFIYKNWRELVYLPWKLLKLLECFAAFNNWLPYCFIKKVLLTQSQHVLSSN